MDQSVPSIPEVRFGNHANGLPQVPPDIRRRGCHDADKLPLDGGDLIFGQLVIATIIDVVEAEKVPEAEGGSEARVGREGIRGNDLQQNERVLRLDFVGQQGGLSCGDMSYYLLTLDRARKKHATGEGVQQEYIPILY